jgi:RNA polymerase sigma-70 factor (ECF subfamily)
MNNTRTRAEAWTLQVVARVKQGDRQAVRHLYARYAPAVRTSVAPILRDPDAVDDVVQTTFLKLLTRLDAYQPGDVPFEAWLLRVARNAAIDELRRRRRRDSVPMSDGDGAQAGPSAPELPVALDRLPAAYREVLLLRHVVGLSVQETADRLGTTPRTVRTLQERACAALRAELAAQAPGEHRRRPAVARPVVERLA